MRIRVGYEAERQVGEKMQNNCEYGRRMYVSLRIKRELQKMISGRAIFGVLSLFSMLLMLRNSAIAIEYMKNGMGLCVKTVIPSLFPFMVISELLVSFGVGERMAKLLKRPMSLFHVSGTGSSAVILGALCGFPVGARTAVGLYDRGQITKKECEHLLTFSNNPSSAFIISSVGVSLYSDHKLGMILLCVTLTSSLLVGYIMKYHIYSKEERTVRRDDIREVTSSCTGIGIFTGAITSSAMAMLNVCAYVIFFASLIGALGNMLSSIGAGEELRAFLYTIFEMSSGVSGSSALTNVAEGLVMTAFALGWSGISVHCQIVSMCDGRSLDLKPYFISKALQGILCAIAMMLLLLFVPGILSGQTKLAA